MSDITCFYEPITGTGWERRDQLGDFQSYRKHPHLGEDWGFTNGSEGKPIRNVHAGKVTKIWNDPALGWSAVVKNICPNKCEFDGFSIEYNHMIEKPTIAVGAELLAGKDLIGKIGATGSALSASGANHLHASMAKADVPHTMPLDKKVSIAKACDRSSKQRKLNMEAKKNA
jgi:hypothetical protein